MSPLPLSPVISLAPLKTITLPMPWSATWDAGDENGFASFDVIRFSRSRLFFFPSAVDPSTSQSGRRLFGGRSADDAATLSNRNMLHGVAWKMNVNVVCAPPSNQAT